jgi:2-polyprenyl-3-methyl-5-hydroxy-6-metoxy-1,4-benzoquinol methylase
MLTGIREVIKNIVPASMRETIRSSIGASIMPSRFRIIAKHVMRAHATTYDKDYYDTAVEPGAVQSAAVMAKSIVECFEPKTIIDVGCGTGALLEAFRNLNCRVFGLEYSDAGLAYCRRRNLAVRKFNIGKDRIDAELYDVAVSFEVAEHLSPWLANRFVDLLCNLSPLVIMSAATPGQGGKDHVNEQPQSYWVEKFRRNGYVFDESISDQFSSDWKSAGAASWYYNNVMVFARHE